MSRHTVLFAVSIVLAELALVGMATTPAAAQSRTVWDGVYTEAQARRGQERYKDICGYCHRDDLQGGGSEAGAPALKGSIFTTRWQDRALVEMFLAIGTTMPQNAPDTLTPQVVIDIVSFLLEANEMPAGETELPPDLEALDQILVTERTAR
jgi:mono/diheme cytochrome c family protein